MPSKLCSDTAKLRINIVKKLEGIAAGHITGNLNSISNTPIHEASELAYQVAQDMMQCPSAVWPMDGPDFVHRYIPAMRRQLGDTDEDIEHIERAILPHIKEKTKQKKKKSANGRRINNKKKKKCCKK